MAYTPANLSLVSAAPLSGGLQEWVHTSADAGATVDTNGFISDAGQRGVKVGDFVKHTDSSTFITTQHRVMSLSTTSPYSANLSDTTTVASGTNTD